VPCSTPQRTGAEGLENGPFHSYDNSVFVRDSCDLRSVMSRVLPVAASPTGERRMQATPTPQDKASKACLFLFFLYLRSLLQNPQQGMIIII